MNTKTNPAPFAKIPDGDALIVWACGNCGRAATWNNDGSNVDPEAGTPYCEDCEQCMNFEGVCVRMNLLRTSY
jgi:hypothetical protein